MTSEFQRRKVSELQRDILKTLAYADIFDYPLTAREVLSFLISDTEVAFEVVQERLKILADPSASSGQVLRRICTDGKFYFLKGRSGIVGIRKKREGWSKKKLKIAQLTAEKLSWFPWIKMIGVTGALAMENCEVFDDIDLIIVTATSRLWLTRLILYILAPILRIRRRKPKEKVVKDKTCFNLFLDENHLKIEPESLFLSHEIAQVKPILNKDSTYEKFLWENGWVRKFLPNGVKISARCKVQGAKLRRRRSISQYLNFLISFFDTIAFKLQYFYMSSKITNEKVSHHQAFFHPINLDDKITTEFRERLKVLTKKPT